MAGSTTSSPSAASKRLPVNPRRHRVAADQRKRVSTACNNCNVRRIKCSGDHPCKQCNSSSRDCQYPVAVDKVTIPRSELEELQDRCKALEKALQDAVPDGPQRHRLLSRFVAPGAADSPHSREETSTEEETPQSHGRLLHDGEGTVRYLGEISGAAFLDNLKQFMATIFPLAFNGNIADTGDTFLASVGRYNTHESRPLLTLDVDPLWLPSAEEMTTRLQELRWFIQEGGGVSGGIMYWGNLTELPQIPPLTSTPPTPMDWRNNRSLARYQAAFAYSTLLGLTGENSKRPGQLGEPFFQRARMLLRSPLDITMYNTSDVASMAVMGLYLMELNRRDACYIYIAVAMHISIMHGVHRGWSVDEPGKRSFWTVYVLDRWMSCLMGRPPIIPDDAISLDLPEEGPGLPNPIGLRANIGLSRISGYIVCNTYQIAPWTDGPRSKARHVDKALQLLTDWLRALPAELQMSYETFSRDRPLCNLHMKYNQLLILAIRPIFFMAVKKAVADRFVSRQWNIEQHKQIGHIRDCSDAARRNLRLGRWLQALTPSAKLTVPELHNIFNAAIILLLHQIVFVNLRTNDISDIAFGVETFEREAAAGDSYGKDCAKVLRDLSALVHRLRRLMFEGVPQISPNTPPAPPEPAMLFYGLTPIAEPPEGPVIPIETPRGDALYQELVTWLDNDVSQG